MCAIWFGILVVKMAEFCLITPPIGLNCFVVAGVRPELSVQDVFRGVMPFFIADGITIGLLVAFPMIVLWLPGLKSERPSARGGDGAAGGGARRPCPLGSCSRPASR